MKVGSKVVYVSGPNCHVSDRKYKKGKVYTVNRVFNDTDGTLLINVDGVEYMMSWRGVLMGSPAYAFREIDTRPELSETTYDDIMTEIETKELQTA